MIAPLPLDEEERIKALRRCKILDTDPEPQFDDITLLASRICGTPIAMISLVDENRQWFKSKRGITGSETARDIAFCAHGILQAEVFVVNDALADERFAENPLVTGNPRIRFYAGAPLITADGHALGMLCVNDQVPRELSADQIEALQALSRQVVSQFELKRSLSEIQQTFSQLKRTEELLRESEERFSGAFEYAPIGVALVSPDGRWMKVNRALCELVGYSEAELLTRTFQDITHPEDLESDLENVRGMIAGEIRSYQMEKRYIHARGHHVTVLLDVSLVRNGQDQPLYFIAQIQDISSRKQAEAELENVHRQLLEASRLGGMAEIATNVLHNIGNVLNSVNISAGVVLDSIKRSKVSSLGKVVSLLRENEHDLGAFFTVDRRGKQLPAYLSQLSQRLIDDQKAAAGELDSLRDNIEHIKVIVAMQQRYAKVSGVREIINLHELVEDGLRINESALSRHGVEVVREFEEAPPMNVEKHKILQILVNLMRNAKHACQDSKRPDPRLTVRVASGEGRIKISVSDNGIGIPPENLTRIFNHGFTTRKTGHGFGLHSGALAANGLGGTLTAHSEGPGKGATFTLELPV